MKKYILSALTIAASVAFTSCESYLDINDDPNNVTESKVSASDVFPGCEGAIINTYGGTWNYYGAFLAEQFAQSSAVWQWGQFGCFQITASDSNSGYNNFYIGALNNLNVVLSKAEAAEDWGTYLAGTVMRVFCFQVLTDAYGGCPYSEALDLTNTTPVWDDGAAVYSGILAELNQALSKPINPTEAVCTNLLLSGKPASEWIKAANALKLRLLMRISNVSNVQSELAALVAENNFPSQDLAWAGIWANAQYKCNPFYGQFTDSGNHAPWVQLNIASQRVYEQAADTRMEYYFSPGGSGDYVGWLSGCYPSSTFADAYRDDAVSRAVLTYDKPVYFITVAETEFFLSEYQARYGSASAAKEHYENAIRASFALTAGLPESDADQVIAVWPYDQSNYARSIGIQKWIHLTSVNGFEGWCELRRLRYPAFGSVTGDDLISFTQAASVNYDLLTPGDIYTPPSWERNPDVGVNTLVERWPYPSNSSNNNPNTPSFVPITTKVFWAQ